MLIKSFSTYLFLVFFTYLFVGSNFSQNLPPKTEKREVKNTCFGTTITDNYRWLEDLKSEEVQNWMKAQSDYSRKHLDNLPLREEILKELAAMSDAGVRINGVQKHGNNYFYYRIAPNENEIKVYVREGLNGQERLLIDPEKIVNDDKLRSIDSFTLSKDGKYLSYIVSVGGRETGELRVVEVKTGKETGDVIDSVRFNPGDWLPNTNAFIYTRMQKLPADATAEAKEYFHKTKVYLHILGTNPESDKPIFGYEVNPNIEIKPSEVSYGSIPIGSKYAFGILSKGVSVNIEFYLAKTEDLKKKNSDKIEWKKLAGYDDETYAAFGVKDDDVYFMSFKNTPRYKIIRKNLSMPNGEELIFTHPRAVITDFLLARDALYVETLDGGTNKIYRVDYQTKKVELIKTPYQGSARIGSADLNEDGIEYSLTSWTKSNTRFRYNPATKNSIDTKLIPRLPIDMSDIEFVNVQAKSYDGTLVPMVIIYKKGIKLNGQNPTYMDGYGAYGFENTSPYFMPHLLPWLRRGGIVVYAGVRGGGEYGEEWHQAAMKEKKPNSWKDFFACAKYLIDKKYTSPKHLGITGASAGGILISNSIAERPDLFSAAVISVGVTNPLLFLTDSTGVDHGIEFGSPQTEEGFKSVLAIDGYYKIKDGVKYPAVLLTQGMNDTRVTPWQSSKMTARLQAATTSGKPILLRLNYDA